MDRRKNGVDKEIKIGIKAFVHEFQFIQLCRFYVAQICWRKMCTQKVEQVHDLDRMREGRGGGKPTSTHHSVSSFLLTWLLLVLFSIYWFSG